MDKKNLFYNSTCSNLSSLITKIPLKVMEIMAMWKSLFFLKQHNLWKSILRSLMNGNMKIAEILFLIACLEVT